MGSSDRHGESNVENGAVHRPICSYQQHYGGDGGFPQTQNERLRISNPFLFRSLTSMSSTGTCLLLFHHYCYLSLSSCMRRIEDLRLLLCVSYYCYYVCTYEENHNT